MKYASLCELIKCAEKMGSSNIVVSASGTKIEFLGSLQLDSEDKVDTITCRSDIVYSLAFHDGRLYDAGRYGIYDTMNDKKVAERRVINLVSHNGVLFDAGNSVLFETLNGKEIGKLNFFTRGLAVYDNKFFYGWQLGVKNTDSLQDTYNALSSRERGDGHTFALTTHKGVLYDAGTYGVYETISNKKVAERPAPVKTLFTHNGNLYDAGWYGVEKTLNDEAEDELLGGVRFWDEPSALISIPLSFWIGACLNDG